MIIFAGVVARRNLNLNGIVFPDRIIQCLCRSGRQAPCKRFIRIDREIEVVFVICNPDFRFRTCRLLVPGLQKTSGRLSFEPCLLVESAVNHDFSDSLFRDQFLFGGKLFPELRRRLLPELPQEPAIQCDAFAYQCIFRCVFRLFQHFKQFFLRTRNVQTECRAVLSIEYGMSGGIFPELFPEIMVFFHDRSRFAVINVIGFRQQVIDIQTGIPEQFCRRVDCLPFGKKCIGRIVCVSIFLRISSVGGRDFVKPD